MAEEYGNSSGSALPDAVAWIAHLATGTVATVVATLAIALMGFAMLGGRLDIRSGLRIVLGCFVLFDAGQIANGIVQFAYGDGRPTSSASVAIAPPALPSAAPQFDPYAGAATPQ